jgi:hypothetical protein
MDTRIDLKMRKPTAISFPRGNREENKMSILSTIGRFAAEYSAARNRFLTERQVRSLPFEIQKDIGWPDSYTRRDVTRSSLGAWAGSK